MKNLLTLSFVLLIFAGFTGCGTSSQNGDTYPFTESTWQVQSASNAEWQGSNSVASVKSKAFNSAADSTSPDTSYFYDNGQIQAEVTKKTGPVFKYGQFEFVITDETLNSTSLYDSLDFGGIEIQNVGSAINIVGYRGTTSTDSWVRFEIQANFDCDAPELQDENLRIAFLTYNNGASLQDTSMVYELSTNGLNSSVNHIVCES